MATWSLANYKFSPGDRITMNADGIPEIFRAIIYFNAESVTQTARDNISGFTGTNVWYKNGKLYFTATGIDDNFSFVYGTASSKTCTARLHVNYNSSHYEYTLTFVLAYDGDDTVTATRTVTKLSGNNSLVLGDVTGSLFLNAYGYSTYPAWLAQYDSVCIDCELGEVYAYDGNQIVSLNPWVSLGSDLPNLSPGPNVVNFDNTLFNVKISPRWWRL